MTSYGQFCSVARAHEALGGRWTPLVIRFDLSGHAARFLLLRPTEASLCSQNPGFPEALCLSGPLAARVSWWRGDASFAESRRRGLALTGLRDLVRAFPGWFQRYLFAGIAPARSREGAEERPGP